MSQKTYLTEEEASHRYSLPPEWFQRARWVGNGPSYIKINGTGEILYPNASSFIKVIGTKKILYPVESTDDWFRNFQTQS
jgi:hypothetical protein